LQDVLRDLQARSDALTAEAHDAKRHAELSSQALQLRFTAAKARQTSLVQEIKQLTHDRGHLESALVEGRSAIAQRRSLLEAARTAHDRTQERLRAAASDFEARRGDVRLAEERSQNFKARLAEQRQRRQANGGEIARLEATQAPREPDRSVSQGLAVSEQHAERLRTATTAANAALERLRAAVVELERRRQSAGTYERAVAAYESRLAALREQKAAISGRLETAESTRPEVDLGDLQEEENAAKEARQASSIALELRRQELAEVHSKQALAAAEAMSSKR